MSSYIRNIIFISVITIFSGCSISSNNILAQKKEQQKNDILLLIALDSEKFDNYDRTYTYYNLLYKKTNTILYLKKALLYAFKSNNIKAMEKLAKDGLEKDKKDEEFYLRQLIVVYLMKKDYKNSLKISQKLLKKYPNGINYELIASVYFLNKQYKKAATYYESAYIETKSITSLLKLVDIRYSYLNQKKEALAQLETYIQTNKCQKDICTKLMLIYQEQGNIDGMLTILTKMYHKYTDDPSSSQAAKSIKDLIITLLQKQPKDKVIKYLEKTKLDDKYLANIYYQTNKLKKALKLTKKLYKKHHDPELLGKIAMYRFELAKDKRKVLKNVIANFELALSSGINNPVFQNYYGYILIDYDIDIKKGVTLIKNALKLQPNNIAYIDSLAWGYYKLGKCNKAYKLMQKVIDVVGLSDKEIASHWKAMQKCKKTN